jgi:RNA 2',3'-cyclic 3'-phosphodiesterase
VTRAAVKPVKAPFRKPQSHLFYAVFVPSELHAPLELLQSPVKIGWKTTAAAQLHVTLAFMGEAAEEPLSTFLEAGRGVASTLEPFSVNLRGTGFYPTDGSPRVWFLKADAPQLQLISSGLVERLALIPDHKFQPHVTLARKRMRGPKPPTLTANLEFQVTQFALVRSFLQRDGPQYSILEKFHLNQPELPRASLTEALQL